MLDTPDERRFDSITGLLKEMFQVRALYCTCCASQDM